MALITEFTGAKAGAAISQMSKTFAGPGLANDHTRIKEWQRLGLVGKDDLDYTSTGEAKGLKPGRHVTGWRQGRTDPDAFIKEVLLPKFAALNITDPVEQSAEMTRLFGGKISPAMADRFRSQAELLDTRSKSYLTAGGPGAGENLTAHDPTAALAEAEQALSNMIAVTSKPLIEVFAPAADTFAKAVASFVADKVMPAVEAHPYLTAAAGAVISYS
jgi:hypothetical protein